MLLANKRVFVVEDNLENRVLMTMMLEQQGARTQFERWGRDALPRLKAFMPVDIILLDLMLPHGVTGFDIFDEIRAHSEFAGIPVVAVSAQDASLAIPKTMEKGFSGFIAKPVDYDLFPKQVAQIIAREPVWYSGLDNNSWRK
jgi:CheY-like chemotaxis protein